MEHAGTLGPVARGRLDYLRSLGGYGSLAERMVVVEGRIPVAVPSGGASDALGRHAVALASVREVSPRGPARSGSCC